MTVTLELQPEEEKALKAAAQAQGISTEAWLRQVVEERLQTGDPLAEEGSTGPDDRPISAMFREIWGDMPDEVRAKLPSDGADQHDHYICGTPKRAL